MLTLIICSIFVSIGLLVGISLYRLLNKGEALKSRLDKLMPEKEEHVALIHTSKKWQLRLADMGRKVKVKPDALHNYRQMTTAAGFRAERVYVILGSKIVLAVALPVAYMFLWALPHGEMGKSNTLLTAAVLAVTGYILPTMWLRHRASRRQEEIFHSIPDVLDLLTVCVEAGLSMDAALIRTEENFENKKDPLIRELNTVTLEVSAGRPRSDALKALAERTGVEDIKAFVTMVIQTEKFGTSLGKTLRTYSDSLRIKRRQIAEEKAAKTAVKMLFPLTFCIFPALMIVMLAPAFHSIYQIFKH